MTIFSSNEFSILSPLGEVFTGFSLLSILLICIYVFLLSLISYILATLSANWPFNCIVFIGFIFCLFLLPYISYLSFGNYWVLTLRTLPSMFDLPLLSLLAFVFIDSPFEPRVFINILSCASLTAWVNSFSWLWSILCWWL